MSTGYEEKLEFTYGYQESMQSAVDEVIARLTAGIDGVSGWRLPTLEKMDFVKEDVTEISNNLENNGKSNFFLGTYKYYYQAEDA